MAIHWPGNTRNWAPEVRKVVRELERLYDVHCYTYPNHGRPGERWSIDIPVALLGQSANARQRALGERVMKRAVLRWRGWGIDYIIWQNRMKEAKDSNWFNYEPFAFKFPFGSRDPETRRHRDHVHLSPASAASPSIPQADKGVVPRLSAKSAAIQRECLLLRLSNLRTS